MIQKIIQFSVNNKLITGALIVALTLWGVYSFTQLSVDALPDVTNNQVQVITNSPNLATQEVEQFITYPLEIEFKSLQNLVELRSTSRSGLSVITIVFNDNVPVNIARQLVSEKLKLAIEKIPSSYGSPEMLPPTTGLGEIYQYVLVPKKGFEHKYSPMELRTIQDWILKRQLLGTPGIVDVSSFGGKLKQYEVSVKPERLAAMNLSLIDVYDALSKNNQNTGGSYIEKSSSIYFIRGEGLIEKLEDINQIVVKNINGIPILIKDIGEAGFGFAPRYGAMTRNGNGETVGAVVLMQKGENAVRVIEKVKERIKIIEKNLPEGLTINSFIDRTKLIDRTIGTVTTNLLEGALIVVFVLVLFLGNFRAGLIVASVIPLAMLFAVSLMNLFGVSANLMSMGALDFGLIVDGAVIVVESLLHKFKKEYKNQTLSENQMNAEVIDGSNKIMSSAVFGQIIILIVYIPIFALSGIEGKMFMPMAQTVSFAIIGALILSITYVPLMSSLFLNKHIQSKQNFTDKAIDWLNSKYEPSLKKALQYKFQILIASVLIFISSIFLFKSLGGEFIPELDEGDFATNYMIRQGSSLSQTIETGTQLEKIAMQFPEVKEVVSKIGTSEIPTDPMPIESADLIIVLKDKKEWTSAKNKEELAEKMKEKMQVIPGVNLSFEQPIQMRFNELIAGVKSDIAIKIFGENLDKLFSKANEVSSLINNVDGLTDIKVEQIVGMPQLVVKYNRNKIAQYGLNITNVNTILNTAYAGGYAGVVYEDEKKFDLVVRIKKDENIDDNTLKSLLIPLQNGKQVPLSEIAEVSFKSGPSQISRENAERRIVIEANARGRDVESVVKDIQKILDTQLKLPEGYFISYGGQFQNLQEANNRLLIAVPIALILIFFLLFLTFRSTTEAIIIFSAIPLAAIGGVIALWIRDMNFSISAGVGFIALFGVAVLNGIVLVSYYNRLNKEEIENITERIILGSTARLRPILATAAVASLGFLPMALSNSAGAEVQKPLATVVIGGLITSTLLTLYILPILYALFMKKVSLKSTHHLKIVSILFFSLALSFNANAQKNILTLDAALNAAYQNHPLLQQHQFQIKQQEELAKTANTLEPFNINGNFGQANTADFDYNISFSQNLRLPKSINAEKKLLSEKLNLSKSAASISKNELTKNTTAVYYNWLHAWLNYKLLKELEETYLNFEKYADKKFNVGETGILEKINAKTQLQHIKIQVNKAFSDIKIFETQVQELTLTSNFTEPDFSNIKINKPILLDSFMIENNALIQYNLQEINLNNAAVLFEKSKATPSIFVGLNTLSLEARLPFYAFTIGSNIPLFKTGIKSKTKAAEFAVKASEKELEKTRNAISSNIKSALLQLSKCETELKYYEKDGIQYADLILNAAEKSYKSGNINYVEYVQNLKEASTIKERYLEVLNDYNQTTIHINYLLSK